MKQLIKKYSILLISAIILSHLLTGIILTIWPTLLTTELPNGGISTLGSGYLTSGFDYLINIAFITLLFKEMKKEKIKSIPILILTFFSSLIGVIFFLFIAAYQKMNIQKQTNMTNLLKVLNKYIVLFIISSLFGMPWFYVRRLLFDSTNYETLNLTEVIPVYINYLIRLIIIILLIIDFKKESLKHIVLTCIATLFYPILGVVILSLLLLEKEKANELI